MVKVILDIEVLFILNRNKVEKEHLIFSEITEEENKEDDITIGIGQKVTSASNKIREQIEKANIKV
jgi:esterase/lipase superfamily enzyme